jgi:hypothetical protein
MEVTKWLKPSGKACHEIRWQRKCAGRNASEYRAILETDNAQADLTAISGKADTTGGMSRQYRQSLCRGSGSSTHTREARATREAPGRGQG